MLSNYQLKITDLYNVSISNAKKLVPNVFNKEEYVIDYKNLQLYTRVLWGEWPSVLKFCDQNRKVPGSNPTWCLAGLRDPTSLRGSR